MLFRFMFALGALLCIGILILVVIILIIAFFLKLLIAFLPATLLAILVYLFTGNLFLTIVAFVVVALILSIVDRKR